jgi:hypothetical protein
MQEYNGGSLHQQVDKMQLLKSESQDWLGVGFHISLVVLLLYKIRQE